STVSSCVNEPAPPQIYTLSLHDALPISLPAVAVGQARGGGGESEGYDVRGGGAGQPQLDAATPGGGEHEQHRDDDVPGDHAGARSEEHTSELQSRENLVCRLLLEKKNTK